VPDVLQPHPGSTHPTDSGQWFTDAQESDASSQRYLTQLLRGQRWLRRRPWLRWPRWLPWLQWPRRWVLRVYENTATERHVDTTCSGPVRSAVSQQCRIRPGQDQVYILRGARINSLGGVRVNISIIRMCSKRFRNRSICGEASRSTYSMVWIVQEKWVGNGPQILGTFRQTHKKPPECAAVGPLQCTAYVIRDRLERPAVAIVAMNPRSLQTPSTVRTRKLC